MSAWEDVLLDSGDQRKPAEWWWAYVTATNPLRIRRELETHPLGSTPSTLVSGLEIGDKVRVVNHLGQALIVGRAGGTRFPYKIATGIFLATVDAANTVKRHTVTYPAGFFDTAPTVTLSYYLSLPDYAAVSMHAMGLASFDFNITRKNTNPTNVIWTAVQT